MTSPFVYDFGYPWSITWIHVIPLVLGLAAAALGVRLGWRRWVVGLSCVIGIWGIVGLILTHTMMGGLNAPQRLPSDQFMASGRGRVLDVGAGSGRALIGLLLARPQATGTALDIYSGFFGITDNTPERMMRNARIAGVADRADTVTADATRMPLPDASYDAAISSYAIDHMGREGSAEGHPGSGPRAQAERRVPAGDCEPGHLGQGDDADPARRPERTLQARPGPLARNAEGRRLRGGRGGNRARRPCIGWRASSSLPRLQGPGGASTTESASTAVVARD